MPLDLLAVLRKRGIDAIHVETSYEAIAGLCLAERDACDERRARSVLILAGIDDPARLQSAIERFAPSARIWLFDRSTTPPLRSFVPPAMKRVKATIEPKDQPTMRADSGPARTPEVVPVPGSDAGLHDRASMNGHGPSRAASSADSVTELKLASRPPDRVIGDGPGGQGAAHAPDAAAKRPTVSARDVLEDAELEMLLAGERGTEGRGR